MFKKTGKSILTGSAILLVLAATSAPALALDTLELFDPGLSEFRFSLSLSGVGWDEGAVGGEVLLGIGITEWLSGQIIGTGEADQHLAGTAANLGFGIFSTPVETDNVGFDIGLNLVAGGNNRSFGDFTLAPFIEINLDSDPDMNGYGAWLVLEEALSGEGTQVKPVTNFLVGAYYVVREGHEFLMAFDVAFNHRNDPATSGEHDTAVGGITLGYNSVLTNSVQLISEILFDIPQDNTAAGIDEDFGFGFMLGFIADLP